MLDYLAARAKLGIVIVAILVFISVPLQKEIDDIRGSSRSINQTLFMSSSALKKISLGYEQILSDIYWLRAIQYFGNPDIQFSDKDPEVLYQYFDVITDLDPKFVNAYRFGGTFLAEPIPIGLGNFEKGIELYNKGRRNNPDNFRLPLEEAFLYYVYKKDYRKAAELFREAADKPGLSDLRSSSIRGMAASSLKRGGDRELSLKIWEYIYNNSGNEGRRNYALQNIKELKAKEMEEKLTDLLHIYIRDKGRYPSDLTELKDSGYLKKIPRDYEGKEFVISKKLNAVKSITLARKELEENVRFYTAKAQRFKKEYGYYPENFSNLKDFIIENSLLIDYRPHPLGYDYNYNPETGNVTYDESILN